MIRLKSILKLLDKDTSVTIVDNRAITVGRKTKDMPEIELRDEALLELKVVRVYMNMGGIEIQINYR